MLKVKHPLASNSRDWPSSQSSSQ